MGAMFQCDECKGFYKSKDARRQHGKRTGHRIESIPSPNGATLEDSSKLQAQILTLSDSINAKDSQIALQVESFKTKEAEFATLHDEITQLSSLEHEQNIVRNVLKKLTSAAYELIGRQLGFVVLEDSGTLGDGPSLDEINDSIVNGQRKQMVNQIKQYGVIDFWADYYAYVKNSENIDAAFEQFADAVISYFRISGQGKMKDSAPAEDPGKTPDTATTTDNPEKTSKLEDHERDPSEYIFIGDKKEQGWQYYPDMGFSLKLS